MKLFKFFSLHLLKPPAPSAVPTVHLMRATAGTLSLSWLPPERPNGVILDYEIKYQERVRNCCASKSPLTEELLNLSQMTLHQAPSMGLTGVSSK